VLWLGQYLLQVPATETSAITFCGLPHISKHQCPPLQVLPELWPFLNLAICEHPFSFTHALSFLLSLYKSNKHVSALVES